MSAIGVECIRENVYRVYRFQYKAHRDIWVTQKPNRRRMSRDKLGNYLRHKARRLMSSSGNECVRITDTRQNNGRN